MNSSDTTPWRKSISSGGDTACVEVRRTDGAIQIRDSKDRSGPVLTFTLAEWRAFVAGAKAGEFDH